MVWALGLCLFGLAPTISILSCCEGMGGGTEHLGFSVDRNRVHIHICIE